MGNVSCCGGRNKPFRLLMLSLDGAGKTVILYQFKLGQFISTAPTEGYNVESISYKDEDFLIWDINSREEGTPLWIHYIHNFHIDGIIFVIDCNDHARFDEARDKLLNVLQHDNLSTPTPVLVYANKQDESGAMTTDEVENKLALYVFANQQRQWNVIGSVATTGEGLNDGLDWLCNAIIK